MVTIVVVTTPSVYSSVAGKTGRGRNHDELWSSQFAVGVFMVTMILNVGLLSLLSYWTVVVTVLHFS